MADALVVLQGTNQETKQPYRLVKVKREYVYNKGFIDALVEAGAETAKVVAKQNSDQNEQA